MASSMDSSVEAVDALVAALDGLEAVDLSPTLRSAMPRFFAHPEFHIIDDARLIDRDRYRLQTLVLPEHVGPHVDAPAHVVAERPEATVDTLDVTALWGRAVGSDDPTCDMGWVDAEPTAAFGHLEYFLPKDIYILENLENLGGLPPVVYFAALPLKIDNGTGSPLRPVAFVPKP